MVRKISLKESIKLDIKRRLEDRKEFQRSFNDERKKYIYEDFGQC